MCIFHQEMKYTVRQVRLGQGIRLGLHGELHEVLHEDSQADVIGEYSLAAHRVVGVVCYRRIQHGQQKARLGLVLIAHDVPNHWKRIQCLRVYVSGRVKNASCASLT